MWLALILVTVASTGGVWWLRRAWIVITVRGVSMHPTYHQGDRVLIRRRPLAAVHSGQVVVLRAGDPQASADENWIIKRIAAAPGDPVPNGRFPVTEPDVPQGELLLLGDNLPMSADSRQRGYYSGTCLVGVVTRLMPGRTNAS
jgi:signal peptidase I